MDDLGELGAAYFSSTCLKYMHHVGMIQQQ
jgi:hypothetical protein